MHYENFNNIIPNNSIIKKIWPWQVFNLLIFSISILEELTIFIVYIFETTYICTRIYMYIYIYMYTIIIYTLTNNMALQKCTYARNDGDS